MAYFIYYNVKSNNSVAEFNYFLLKHLDLPELVTGSCKLSDLGAGKQTQIL